MLRYWSVYIMKNIVGFWIVQPAIILRRRLNTREHARIITLANRLDVKVSKRPCLISEVVRTKSNVEYARP